MTPTERATNLIQRIERLFEGANGPRGSTARLIRRAQMIDLSGRMKPSLTGWVVLRDESFEVQQRFVGYKPWR